MHIGDRQQLPGGDQQPGREPVGVVPTPPTRRIPDPVTRPLNRATASVRTRPRPLTGTGTGTGSVRTGTRLRARVHAGFRSPTSGICPGG
ncbi:hypothetical protein N5079_35260, partial [Planotetraspora sp. A-T 1434]|uniref:hypothetical protein n=1 Tax=Planotetraspora sp. A-T 1434 TaxID=2979219 RepID=UPI0021C24760